MIKLFGFTPSGPLIEYPDETVKHVSIALGICFAAVVAVGGVVTALNASHKYAYDSEVCTKFRASAEAQVMRDDAGPKTVYKITPIKEIKDMECTIY